MALKLILIIAILATNILSLYHLYTTTNFFNLKQQQQPQQPQPQIPTDLLHQLHTIRATITHLTRLHSPPRAHTVPSRPSDLITITQLSPVPTSCYNHHELLCKYMNYTPFQLCPNDDAMLAESLIIRGCHPLPRRRCFTHACKTSNVGNNNVNVKVSEKEFMVYKSSLDLTVMQLMDIAKKDGIVLRLGVDIGGEYGGFAVKMKERNVTVMTTTMNIGANYSEVNARRGVVAMHAPLQNRMPVFDGVVDLVRCGHAVNRWIPLVMLEFLLYDVDRVLRGGGYLWIDHFFCKEVDFESVYKPLFFKLGYKIVKWATGEKRSSKRMKNKEVYLTALLQKPKSR